MCTCIELTSKENEYFLGRTQEYYIDFDYVGIQYPRKYAANKGICSWETVYSVMGVAIQRAENLIAEFVIDGINELDLTGVAQYFSGLNEYSSLDEITASGKFPLLAEQFVFFLLANCKDTYDIEEKILTVAIADVAAGTQPPAAPGLPQHFMFTDASGRSIVVEPSIKLGFKVYENKIGVMTNQPEFNWHIQNLPNYISISDTNTPAENIAGVDVPGPGAGSGLQGLPGDFTPASRFIRAALFKDFSDIVSSTDAVTTLFHLLSTADVVKGVVKLNDENKSRYYTQYTTVYDLKNRTMSMKLYNNINLQKIAFDDAVAAGDTAKNYHFIQSQQYDSLN